MNKVNLQKDINTTSIHIFYDLPAVGGPTTPVQTLTPLMGACAIGNIDIIKELLTRPLINMYAETINIYDNSENKTALLIALENGQVESVKTLLEAKYDVNYKLRSLKELERLTHNYESESDNERNNYNEYFGRREQTLGGDAYNALHEEIKKLLISPFTFALAKKNPPEVRHSMVILLLENGADPREPQEVDTSPLYGIDVLTLAGNRIKEAEEAQQLKRERELAELENRETPPSDFTLPVVEKKTYILLQNHLSFWTPFIHFRCEKSTTIITTVLLVGVRQYNIKDAFLKQFEIDNTDNVNAQQLALRNPENENICSVLPNEILILIIGLTRLVDYTVKNSHIGGEKSTKSIDKGNVFIKNVLQDRENTYGLEENDIYQLSYILMNMTPEGLKQNKKFNECVEKVQNVLDKSLLKKKPQTTARKTAHKTARKTAHKTAHTKNSKRKKKKYSKLKKNLTLHKSLKSVSV